MIGGDYTVAVRQATVTKAPARGKYSVSLPTPRCTAEIHVARAGDEVVVDHASGLHQGIANCRTDELESAPQQIAAHRIGFRGARGHIGQAPPAILLRFAADKTPQVSVETAEFFAHNEEGLRVLDRGRDLQAVAHDAGISEQPLHVARAVAGDRLRAESIERFSIVLPLL